MSSPQHHQTPAEVRERPVCMCVHGGRCSSYAPGHALHLIQARLARATPSEWTDALVEASDPRTGVIVLRRFDDGDAVTVWSGAGAAAAATPGLPVAWHERYDVLDADGRRWNVASARGNAAQRR
ncbi:hypothetical protein [Microbacterium awajiense]